MIKITRLFTTPLTNPLHDRQYARWAARVIKLAAGLTYAGSLHFILFFSIRHPGFLTRVFVQPSQWLPMRYETRLFMSVLLGLGAILVMLFLLWMFWERARTFVYVFFGLECSLVFGAFIAAIINSLLKGQLSYWPAFNALVASRIFIYLLLRAEPRLRRYIASAAPQNKPAAR